MNNIKLSEYVDEWEKIWKSENKAAVEKLIDFLNKEMNVDLYSKYKLNDAVELYNYLKIWLLSFCEEILFKALEYVLIDIETFQKQVVSSLMLTITREKSNSNFITEILIKAGFIDSVQKDENNNFTIISKKLGIIKFRKATDTFNDNKTKEFLNKNDISSACHESALFLIENNKTFRAVTAICEKNLTEKYYHSFALDDDRNVIDLTGNLVMPKEKFYMLYDAEEINNIQYNEYLQVKTDSLKYDESHTLMPLLRIAVYKQIALPM